MDFHAYALEHLMCPRCEARPGDQCATVTGSRASTLHSSRVDPLRAAYAAGYEKRMTDDQGWPTTTPAAPQ